jgi:hypothetical protein
LAHLVLGRIRKLHRRFHRFTAGIVVALLPSTPYLVTHEWPTDASDITNSHSGKLHMGAPTETCLSFQNSYRLIPFTSQKFSNTSTASRSAIPKESQGFFLEPYNNYKLAQTKKNLEPFLGIARRHISHAPT